jgi:acyl-CoA thioesterase-1
VRAPPLIGASYAREFTNLYPDLAREMGVIYQPDFITGVVGVARLMQRDGIHPNAAGAKIVAERLAPTVATALRTTV